VWLDVRIPTKRLTLLAAVLLLVLTAFASLFGGRALRALGGWLVFDEKPSHADAIVVLYTGVEYYPRLMEAAELYRKGLAATIIINGNRKTDELRALEALGFEPCCDWSEDYLRVLALFDVPRDKVITISAEDVYDTMSEAEAVGPVLLGRGIKSIILTTSKSHTRRAHFIWRQCYGDKLTIWSVAARSDPYNPSSWWHEGRQIRWVLAEYGAWVFYYWKLCAGSWS
jgi:uncharacterized SAM-binding protein YcdF (DUF218 family)